MKKLFLSIALCIVVFSLLADVQFSANTKVYLHQQKQLAKKARASSGTGVSVFIKASPDSIAELRKKGIKIHANFDSIATATVPLTMFNSSSLTGVKSVALAQRLYLCNDSAKILSNVPIPSASSELLSKTGKGVIVGMIDTGFDFNHINFLDSLGNNRIVSVYMPEDTTGVAPVIDGDTLPGSCYTTQEQIRNLTTDSEYLHATHTTGTAAGSYVGNKYSGIAPQCEIVACGMPDEKLTDVNIANSLKFIFNYANRQGKPCVVNMSLSSFDGAHDGTSYICRLIDELSDFGKIIVVSSGNDGNKTICIHKDFTTESDTLSTFLTNQYSGQNINGYLSMWSHSAASFSFRFQIVDRNTKEICYTSPWVSELPADSTFEISNEIDDEFGKYYDGSVIYASELNYDNNKFQGLLYVNAKYKDINKSIRVQYVSNQGNSLRGWGSSNMRFVTYNFADHISGDNSMSISDMATGNHSISVGSYDSRSQAAVISGKNASIVAGSNPSNISVFSSYGPDENGVNRPDIVAPGNSLVSSYSRFEKTMSVSDNWVTLYETVDGIKYPYGINRGTSMSAPVVTGAIALWLEMNPQLTSQQVKTVFQNTAIKDAYVIASPEKWGSGKLDVASGIKFLSSESFIGDVNGDGMVNVSDVSALIGVILGEEKSPYSDVNKDGIVDVSDIATLIDKILAK